MCTSLQHKMHRDTLTCNAVEDNSFRYIPGKMLFEGIWFFLPFMYMHNNLGQRDHLN